MRNPNQMTENEVKETIEELQRVHNSMQQQLFKIKEKISYWQRVLLEKQRERIMAANAHRIDTRELELKTGLSREQILKAMTLIKDER